MVKNDFPLVNSSGLIPPADNPWSDLTALLDVLVESGTINTMESALLRLWMSADRWRTDDPELNRVDNLVSELISEGRLGDSERAELFDWLDRHY